MSLPLPFFFDLIALFMFNINTIPIATPFPSSFLLLLLLCLSHRQATIPLLPSFSSSPHPQFIYPSSNSIFPFLLTTLSHIVNSDSSLSFTFSFFTPAYLFAFRTSFSLLSSPTSSSLHLFS
ncbi:MAG: hypothetical protein J3R72DRAFT_53189 [Linnemannia gamsii]|nr:MAG: hypothetical protein J3R72DRAFT_53189 [Linnemannia gamsii]